MMDLTGDDEKYHFSAVEDQTELQYLNTINASRDQMGVLNSNFSLPFVDIYAVCYPTVSQSIQRSTSSIAKLNDAVVDLSKIKILKRPLHIKKILPRHRKKTDETIKGLVGVRKNKVINLNINNYGYQLHANDLGILLTAGAWLTDSVIYNYISLVVKYCEGTLIICSDHLIGMERKNERIAKRWAKYNNLYDNQRIVIAINPNKNHWAVLVVDIWKGIIHSFDSFNRSYVKEYQLVAEFLVCAFNNTIKRPDEKRTMPAVWKYIIEESPKQKNGDDCGVFACTNARYVLLGKQLDFTQVDVKLLRNRIAYELTNGVILKDQTINL